MPTKILETQADRSGSAQEQYRFGGGADEIFAVDDGSPFGYWIDAFKGDDIVHGSDYSDPLGGPGDTLIGGDGSDTILGGQGDDLIYGGNVDGSDGANGKDAIASNVLVGDGVRDPATGGLVGRTVVVVTDPLAPMGDDTILGGNGGVNAIYGDMVGLELSATATFTGGDDTLTGGVDAENLIYGDVGFGANAADPIGPMYIDAGASFLGGNDIITGGADTGGFVTRNEIYGDAAGTAILSDAGASLTGGGDEITGGVGATNTIFGDFQQVRLVAGTAAVGGNDTLIGGAALAGFANQNNLLGDASSVTPFEGAGGWTFTGGNDALTGGEGSQGDLRGDVTSVTLADGATFQGGNDTLIAGGNGSNWAFTDWFLFGDAVNVNGTGTALGGNDRLFSGENSDDVMYGDWQNDNTAGAGTAVGGVDTFVFGALNGNDRIRDFEAGKDVINLSEAGELSWEDLDGIGGDDVLNGADTHVSVSGTNMTIDLGAARGQDPGQHLVTIDGVMELGMDSFDFAALIV